MTEVYRKGLSKGKGFAVSHVACVSIHCAMRETLRSMEVIHARFSFKTALFV